jgi:hypothetical protein
MDAASKIKTFLVALAASFGTAAVVYGDDSDIKTACKGQECKSAKVPDAPRVATVCCDGQVCESGKCPDCKCVGEKVEVAACDVESQKSPPKSGFPTFLSEWLSKSPKFSAQVAIHFGTDPSVQQLVREIPYDLQGDARQTGRVSVVRTVYGDLGTSGRFELANRNFNIVEPNETFVNVAIPTARPTSPITKPMKFTEQISRLQLGEFIGGVINCGHRICTGNKCYDVKDVPVAGIPCDLSGETKADTNEKNEEEEEQILVLPIAPPAPPGGDIAQFSEPIFSDNVNESEASSILRNSGLGNVNISLPVTTVVDLLVAKTELSTRLEMTCQLMDERQLAMDKIQSLANRNATLATQLAVAEARNQMSDALTASVVERAELAIKLASVEPKSSKISGASSVVQTIQEDLSNIRRQIALLRKSPVPFARSVVGKTLPQPYIPTAQLPASQLTWELETTCAGDDTSEKAPVSTVK